MKRSSAQDVEWPCGAINERTASLGPEDRIGMSRARVGAGELDGGFVRGVSYSLDTCCGTNKGKLKRERNGVWGCKAIDSWRHTLPARQGDREMTVFLRNYDLTMIQSQ